MANNMTIFLNRYCEFSVSRSIIPTIKLAMVKFITYVGENSYYKLLMNIEIYHQSAVDTSHHQTRSDYDE